MQFFDGNIVFLALSGPAVILEVAEAPPTSQSDSYRMTIIPIDKTQ
jgi:hypothetical protein